jgi:hypothetical protein
MARLVNHHGPRREPDQGEEGRRRGGEEGRRGGGEKAAAHPPPRIRRRASAAPQCSQSRGWSQGPVTVGPTRLEPRRGSRDGRDRSIATASVTGSGRWRVYSHGEAVKSGGGGGATELARADGARDPCQTFFRLPSDALQTPFRILSDSLEVCKRPSPAALSFLLSLRGGAGRGAGGGGRGR